MGKKTDEPSSFALEDIPRKYLLAPLADIYQPELFEIYKARRSKSGFENAKLNASSEKLFRLYFYQGLNQADRVFVHQEFLDTQSRRYLCTGIVLWTSILTYAILGRTAKYGSFNSLRVVLGGISGYFSYRLYKAYSEHQLEQACDYLYEKYAIR